MIGLDANVVVRYLAQDDSKQSAAASRLLEGVLTQDDPGFVSAIVLCEIAWAWLGGTERRLRRCAHR